MNTLKRNENVYKLKAEDFDLIFPIFPNPTVIILQMLFTIFQLKSIRRIIAVQL